MIVPATINTRRISAQSAARYVTFSYSFTVVNGAAVATFIYPFGAGGRLVDLIVYQRSAGTGGTSFSVDVRKDGVTSMFTTVPVATLASGADQKTDVKGEIALPSGWTRGVLKTDATPDVTKGQYFSVYTAETGTYSPHASVQVVVTFEPKQ